MTRERHIDCRGRRGADVNSGAGRNDIKATLGEIKGMLSAA